MHLGSLKTRCRELNYLISEGDGLILMQGGTYTSSEHHHHQVRKHCQITQWRNEPAINQILLLRLQLSKFQKRFLLRREIWQQTCLDNVVRRYVRWQQVSRHQEVSHFSDCAFLPEVLSPFYTQPYTYIYRKGSRSKSRCNRK